VTRAIWFISIALLTTGCGYHLGNRSPLACHCAVSVPYVVNDLDGLLTAALAAELSRSTHLRYCREGGGLTLQVVLCSVTNYNVGFEYDTNNSGARTQRVVPDEGRLTAIARVELIENCSGSLLMGPFDIEASVDFDYDPLSTENQLAIFSLGQFTQIDLAEDTAELPLFRQLAQKIVNYVITSW
jgi:Lipopolysaccharide-assembly